MSFLFRVVDIETVPDYSLWSPGDPKWKLVPETQLRPGVESRTVSGTVRLVSEEPFAPAHSQRVVAIAWCDVSMDTVSKPKTYELVACDSYADWVPARHVEEARAAERRLLTRFRDVMTESPATLVTWNGRSFDLPVLAMRALHLGVPWGWYYDNRDVRYRYSDQGHLDLMDYLSDFGASRSMKLDDAARLVGLPGKYIPGQEHMDGSKVADVVIWGDVQANKEKISRYCLQDVLQTALIFVRSRYHLEIIDALGYSKSVGSFAGNLAAREALPIDWEKLLIDVVVVQ